MRLAKSPPRSLHEPDQNQSQAARVLAVDEFLRISQENIHVGINALQLASILRLTPFQADDEFGTDSVENAACQYQSSPSPDAVTRRTSRVPGLKERSRVDRLELERKQ